MPVFFQAEWHPPVDMSEYDVCDVCTRATRDLVIMRVVDGPVAVCELCVKELVKFMDLVINNNVRLDRQWSQGRQSTR